MQFSIAFERAGSILTYPFLTRQCLASSFPTSPPLSPWIRPSRVLRRGAVLWACGCDGRKRVKLTDTTCSPAPHPMINFHRTSTPNGGIASLHADSQNFPERPGQPALLRPAPPRPAPPRPGPFDRTRSSCAPLPLPCDPIMMLPRVAYCQGVRTAAEQQGLKCASRRTLRRTAIGRIPVKIVL